MSRWISLWNTTRDAEVCPRCLVADSLWTRGKGLLGRTELPADEGILLVPGTSIHMFGMKFSIDVIYLTRDDVVCDFAPHIAPGKMHVARDQTGQNLKPHAALEVAAGTIERTGVQLGDRLERREL